LNQLGNGKPIVLIVDVEIVIRHFLVQETIIKQDDMTDKHGLEGIIKVWNKFEIVQRHKCYKLHVLNQSPQGEEGHVSDQQYEELDHYDSDHNVVKCDCHIPVESHLLIYKTSVKVGILSLPLKSNCIPILNYVVTF
jgi:hypothetical protein